MSDGIIHRSGVCKTRFRPYEAPGLIEFGGLSLRMFASRVYYYYYYY